VFDSLIKSIHIYIRPGESIRIDTDRFSHHYLKLCLFLSLNKPRHDLVRYRRAITFDHDSWWSVETLLAHLLTPTFILSPWWH